MQGQSRFRPMDMGFVRAAVAAVALFASTAPASAQVVRPEGRTKKGAPGGEAKAVQFMTGDGVTIEADFYPPKAAGHEKAPVAILIHMYPANRSSWKPLVPSLREAGFAVLAYDIRGTGGSIEPKEKNLRKRYKAGDSDLFNNAWRDTEAAKDWLAGQPACDASRIVLVGASIGCSVSLHYGSRDEAVKAIVCLSPGAKYFGVDSKKHIKACGKRAILLISPEGEYKAVKKLIRASGGVAKGKKYAGTRKQHGTRLLQSADGDKVKRRIVVFLKKALAAAEKKDDASPKPGKKKKPPRRNI